jgi:hypothetical protein
MICVISEPCELGLKASHIVESALLAAKVGGRSER